MQEILLVFCVFGIGLILRNQRKTIDKLHQDLEKEYARGFSDGKNSVLNAYNNEDSLNE